MNSSLSSLRATAYSALRGNWGMAVLVTFVYALLIGFVSTIASIPDFVHTLSSMSAPVCDEQAAAIAQLKASSVTALLSLVFTFVLLPVAWGSYCVFLQLLRGKAPDVSTLFVGYKDGRIFSTEALRAVYTMLWSLLLIIPGIVKYYQYALTSYILLDHPELKNNAAIERSMQLMRGHCWRLFLLDLSFIGWYLLCSLITVCTCGLGAVSFLFLFPYWAAARGAFYEEVRANQ